MKGIRRTFNLFHKILRSISACTFQYSHTPAELRIVFKIITHLNITRNSNSIILENEYFS